MSSTLHTLVVVALARLDCTKTWASALTVDDNARKLILHDLKLRYFVPKIKNIRSVRIDHGFATFIVVTDYGNMKFIVRSSGDAATRLSDKRIIFTDIDGNRYEIEDLDKLSAIETKRIDVFL